MERRRSLRFDIQLSCRLRRGGSQETVSARTLNLGRLGALIEAECFHHVAAIPQPGDAVDLEILLPTNDAFGQRCLACEGVAMRASNEGTRYQIALRFDSVEIRKVPEVPTEARMAVM